MLEGNTTSSHDSILINLSPESKSLLCIFYITFISNHRPTFFCRTSFDLRQLEIDKTHDITLNLEDEAGSLRVMITITGAVSSTDHEVAHTTRKEITRKYVSL